MAQSDQERENFTGKQPEDAGALFAVHGYVYIEQYYFKTSGAQVFVVWRKNKGPEESRCFVVLG